MRLADIKSIRTSQVKALFTLAFASLVMAGCGTSGTDASLTGGASFSNLYTNTFEPNCVQCHSPGNSAYNTSAHIDFTTKQTAYSTLTSLLSVSPSNSQCRNIKIVNSGHPESSYLVAVTVSSYQNSNSGQSGCVPYQMGSGHNFNLSSSEESAIVSWVQSGAANN